MNYKHVSIGEYPDENKHCVRLKAFVGTTVEFTVSTSFDQKPSAEIMARAKEKVRRELINIINPEISDALKLLVKLKHDIYLLDPPAVNPQPCFDLCDAIINLLKL